MKTAFLWIAFLIPSFGFAEDPAVFSRNQALEKRLQEFVWSYDANAIVGLTVDSPPVETALPGLAPGGKKTSVPLKGRVMIHSTLETFDPGLIEAMRAHLLNFGIQAEFAVEKIKSRSAIARDDERSAALQKSIDEIKSSTSASREEIDTLQRTRWILLTISTACLAACLFMLFLGKQFSAAVGKVFSGQAASSTPAAAPKEKAERLERNASPVGPAPSGESSESQLPVPALREFFSDCYWCENDGEAAYVWGRLDASKKRELMEDMPGRAEYFQKIQDVTAVPNRTCFDLSYLRPLNLGHLANAELRLLLLRYPAAYRTMSPLRRRHLRLDFNELGAFLKQGASAFDSAAFRKSASELSSMPRALRAPVSYRLQDVEEELRLVDLEIPSREVILELPSLVWLTRLPEPALRGLLEEWSARNLARVWHGPESTLTFLESRLHPEKVRLIKSFRAGSNDRDDEVLRELLREALARTTEDPNAQAA